MIGLWFAYDLLFDLLMGFVNIEYLQVLSSIAYEFRFFLLRSLEFSNLELSRNLH